jgi:hypothetical protein
MKKITKILALVLMLALTVTLFAACGGEKTDADGDSGDAKVKGETQTWGNVTLFVPEEYTLNGGNVIDPEDPDVLTLNKGDSFRDYIMLSANFTEDNATSSIDTTRSLNDGAEDIEIAAGANTWKGVAYNASGVDCISVYANIGEGYVVVSSAGLTKDDAVLSAVLESVQVK